MQFWRRGGGPALLLLALVMTAVPTTAASAARTRRAPPPPKPKPGWLVEQARIEPLVPGGVVGVTGVGEYRGALEFRPSPNGGVAVVNDVEFEEYVKGLAEVPSSWPMEAQKAQAIAARTYALAELSLPANVATASRAVGAQICATDACQVYAGVAKERNADNAATFGNWAAAVAQTAGEVVLFQNAPIVAKYSSSNGGRSVYGGRPYLKAVADPDDRHSPLHRWRSQLLNTDVAAALGVQGVLVRLQRSGDTVVADWQGGDGQTGQVTVAATEFRSRVNAAVGAPPGLPRAVPSIWFTPSAEASTNTVVVDGGGWGHGIGMSQWGAYGKALRGMKAPDILAAYYGGLRPTRLDASRIPRTIRVAVDLGRPAADITADGRFRVLDQSGRAVAVATSGAWRIVPEGKGVRVVPPPGQDATPVVQPLAVDPAAPTTTTGPVTVRFRLTTPAVVQLTLVDETGAAAASTPPGLVEAGDLAHAITAPSRPGRYVVTILADAGGGRLTTVPVPVEVHAEPVASIGPTTTASAAGPRGWAAGTKTGAGGGPVAPADRNAVAALAAALLAAVATALGRHVRRGPVPAGPGPWAGLSGMSQRVRNASRRIRRIPR